MKFSRFINFWLENCLLGLVFMFFLFRVKKIADLIAKAWLKKI